MADTQEDIEQLLIDDSFIRWINGKANENEKRHWHQWLQQDPARLDLVKKARHLYQSLTFEEDFPSTITELNRLREAVDKYETNKKMSPMLHQHSRKRNTGITFWRSVAAVLILLVSVLIVVQLIDWNTGKEISNETIYATATTEYGQIKKLTLLDSSEVVLSADSKLTYPQNSDGDNLTVKLEGEAYFSIDHKTGVESRNFTVETSEGQVTVLGTKFNVNTRSDKTEVVLEEGKVHVEVTDTSSAVKSNYYYTMKPGERALLSPQQEGINVEVTTPDLFTSWRNLEFKFHNTSLIEIAERIEQFYGKKVEFKDEKLKKIKFSGSVTNKNIVVLLDGLRTLLDIPIVNRKQTIVIGR